MTSLFNNLFSSDGFASAPKGQNAAKSSAAHGANAFLKNPLLKNETIQNASRFDDILNAASKAVGKMAKLTAKKESLQTSSQETGSALSSKAASLEVPSQASQETSAEKISETNSDALQPEHSTTGLYQAETPVQEYDTVLADEERKSRQSDNNATLPFVPLPILEAVPLDLENPPLENDAASSAPVVLEASVSSISEKQAPLEETEKATENHPVFSAGTFSVALAGSVSLKQSAGTSQDNAEQNFDKNSSAMPSDEELAALPVKAVKTTQPPAQTLNTVAIVQGTGGPEKIAVSVSVLESSSESSGKTFSNQDASSGQFANALPVDKSAFEDPFQNTKAAKLDEPVGSLEKLLRQLKSSGGHIESVTDANAATKHPVSEKSNENKVEESPVNSSLVNSTVAKSQALKPENAVADNFKQVLAFQNKAQAEITKPSQALETVSVSAGKGNGPLNLSEKSTASAAQELSSPLLGLQSESGNANTSDASKNPEQDSLPAAPKQAPSEQFLIDKAAGDKTLNPNFPGEKTSIGNVSANQLANEKLSDDLLNADASSADISGPDVLGAKDLEPSAHAQQAHNASASQHQSGSDSASHALNNTLNAQPLSLKEMLASQAGLSASEQVAQGVTDGLKVNRPEIVIKLSPDNLGDVRVKLSTNALQEVSARLMVDNPEAHDLLKEQMGQLKQHLEAQGIRTETISVAMAAKSDQSFSQHNHNSQSSQQENAHQQNGSSQQQQQQQENTQQFYQQLTQQPKPFASYTSAQDNNAGNQGTLDEGASSSGSANVSEPGKPANPHGSISVFA
ncbi:MAG: flagellar hook-length control protein FliK [Vampirovibrionales bacterium]|nr:flagellar hook-length control protein FliK [Vampirovibrionales bacterium]